MDIPYFYIDLAYFFRLGDMSLPVMMWRIFLDFGWIPFIFIMIRGAWLLWVQWRKNLFDATITTCVLAVDVPRMNEQTAKAVEHIFSTIAGAYSGLDRFEKYWLGKFQPSFSFEIVSIGGYVQFLVHTWVKHRDLVEAAIFAQYPDAEIVEVADYTDSIPRKYPNPEWNVFGTEFVLKRPCHLPIRTYPMFEQTSAEFPFKDPISATLEVLGSLKEGEQMWLQILITPTDNDWIKEGIKAVDKMLGKKAPPKKSMFGDALWLPTGVAKEMAGLFSTGTAKPEEKKKDDFRMLNMSPGERDVVEAAQMKMSKIGFKTKIRLVYAGRRNIFSKKRFTAIKGTLMQLNALNMNEFKPYGKVTPKSDYFYQRWSEPEKQIKLVRNYRNRSNAGATPYILNTEELATLYHFPMLDVKAPSIKKTDAKRSEPPAALPMKGFTPQNLFKPLKQPDDEQSDAQKGPPPSGLPFA